MKNYAVVLGYWSSVKYSVHVILGAAESHGLVDEVDFYLVDLENVLQTVSELKDRYSKVFYMQTLLTTELPSIYRRLIHVNEKLKMLGIASVGGGPHATGDPFGTVLSLGFSYAFVGEVEEVLPQVVELGFGKLDPSAVPGLFYINSDRFFLNGRGFVKDINKYPPFSPSLGLFNPIELSRGCFHSCRYCQVSYIHSTKVRHRSVDDVLRWCGLLLDRGIRDLRFISPDALSYGCNAPSRISGDVFNLVERLSLLKKRGGRIYFGTFPSEMRPEHIDEEVARFLKSHVSNERVNIGAQSGSDESLVKINRGHTSEDVVRAVDDLVKTGFSVDVDYILGLPDETPEDLRLTLAHMKEVVKKGGRIRIHYFIPLPGTPYALRNPSEVPSWVKNEVLKLVGSGRAYGSWLNQERVAREVLRLRDEGVILATSLRARDALSRASERALS
ncbi:MAG: TIGR04013 family B12-binding domain/radical SAM domain-containing protein [Zestosphaera sp.]